MLAAATGEGLRDTLPSHRTRVSEGIADYFSGLLGFHTAGRGFCSVVCVHIPGIWVRTQYSVQNRFQDPRRLAVVLLLIVLQL